MGAKPSKKLPVEFTGRFVRHVVASMHEHRREVQIERYPIVAEFGAQLRLACDTGPKVATSGAYPRWTLGIVDAHLTLSIREHAG